MKTPDQPNGKQSLDLLRFNYENLNKAVWDNHRISWTMTGILWPVMSAATGLLLKDLAGLSRIQTVAGGCVVLVLVWFWWFALLIFRRFNMARFDQMRKLELLLNGYLDAGRLMASQKPVEEHLFRQASLRYTSPRRSRRKPGQSPPVGDEGATLVSYGRLTLTFAILLTLLAIAIMAVKLTGWTWALAAPASAPPAP